MAGPWEKYQQTAIAQPQPVQAGPWAKYQASDVPEAMPEPEEVAGPTFGEQVGGNALGLLKGAMRSVKWVPDLVNTFAPNSATQAASDFFQEGIDGADSLAPEAFRQQQARPVIFRDENGEVDWQLPTLGQGVGLVTESLPQIPAMLVGGGAAAKGLQGIGVAKGVAQAGGFGAANSAMVTSLQHDETMREALAEGQAKGLAGDQLEQYANERANAVAGMVAPLSFATGAAGLGLSARIGEGSGNVLTGFAKGVVTDAPFEALEEGGQSVAADIAMQRQVDSVAAMNAGALGSVAGGAMGGALGAGAGRSRATPGPIEPLAEAADATFENTPEPAALPAAGLQGLPASEQVFYADSQGKVQDTGPVRNVDGEMQPATQARQWVNPQNDPARPVGGPGMEQQVARGAPAPLEGQLQLGAKAESAEPLREPRTIEAEPERAALPAPDAIVVDSAGNAQRGPTAPRLNERSQGGRGMDQQAPTAVRSQQGFEYLNKTNGEPFQAPGAAKASKAFREAVKGGRQPTVAKVAGGYSIRVPALQQNYEMRPQNIDSGMQAEPAVGMPADPLKAGDNGGDLVTPAAEPKLSSLSSKPAGPRKGPRRAVDRDRDSLVKAVIRLGGIKTNWRQDTTGDAKGNKHVPGVGALWSDKTGTSIDDMASLLEQHGYVPAGEMDNLGGVPWLQSALRDELAGLKVTYAPDSIAQQEQMEQELAERYSDEQARAEDEREAEYARIEAEYGADIAAQARAYDEAFRACVDQLNEESKRYDNEIQERDSAGADSFEYGGDQGAAAPEAAGDDQVRGTDGETLGVERAAEGNEETAPGGNGRGAFALEQQSERSLKEQTERQAQAAKAKADADRKADEKRQADTDRDDFLLTGSNRPADVAEARGQNDMFGASPRAKADGDSPATPEPKKPAAAKIDDFGEKIEGARKFQQYKDRLDAAMAEDIGAVPLSKSWPEPDYQSLLDQGADSWGVAFARAARDEIPTKPSKSYKVKRWIDQVELLRGLARRMMGDSKFSANAKDTLLNEFPALKSFAGRIELYERFGHAHSLKGVTFESHYYSIYRGEKNVTKWIIAKEAKATALSNWPTELAVGNTRDEALDIFARVHSR
ncbi:hypothetical protein [Pseudomonas anguilliseptica]|uniref:hypothetical protein n=1 Tax=Pseudomonas anguilliseptica TaxID=53406 RepID=UPI00325C07C5